MCVQVTLRRFNVTVVFDAKQWELHILCVFVALVINHVKRTRRVILSSVVCLVLPYCCILCHKRHDFFGGKNIIEHKTFVDFVYIFCVKHFSFQGEFR
jgi:hypothetical protein